MVALKVARVGGTGATFLTPSLKLARVGGTGTAAVILNPIANQTVDPETVVTVTAVLAVGGSADSYTWRQVSGPTVSLTPVGAVATFLAPSYMPPAGATIVVGVTATDDGTTSSERTTTITVRPQTRWTLSSSRVFVGATHDADIS